MTSGVPRTNESIIDTLNTLGYSLIYIYKKEKRNQNRVVIKDSSGYKFDLELNTLLDNKGNANFVDVSNPFSTENISLWLKIKNKGFYICKGCFYLNRSDKLKLYCNVCKDVFFMAWHEIQDGQNCSVCRGLQVGERHSLGHLRKDLLKEWNSENNISPFEIIVGSGKLVLWNCKKCKEMYDSSPYERTIGRNCPYCSGKRVSVKNSLLYNYPEVSLDWDYSRNKTFSPETITWGSGKPAHWICSKCKHGWKTFMIADRTSGGRGCPKCKSSNGEKRINFLLYKMGFSEPDDFITEKKFSDCKNKRPLPFDFYFHTLKIVIEFHGEQHYKPIAFFGGEKGFLERIRNDSIKRNYCKNKGIQFLEISYKDFKNIEKILTETLLL